MRLMCYNYITTCTFWQQ